MRGLPGSGKSTYLKENYPGAVVCSADNYFIVRTEDGGEFYDFEPRLLPEAHKSCMQKFLRAVTEGVSTVAVDNTNVRVWEASPYYQVATAMGYEVEVIRVVADPLICAARNIHGVPKDAVIRMAGSFEPALPWWGEKSV